MTNRGTKLDQARESLDRTRDALARNVGTLTEQDWREAVTRAEARVAALTPTVQQSTFTRKLRNLESAYRRLDGGQLTGRNSDSSDRTRAMQHADLAQLARTDSVCELLDADEKLAARWNRLERRGAGLPV